MIKFLWIFIRVVDLNLPTARTAFIYALRSLFLADLYIVIPVHAYTSRSNPTNHHLLDILALNSQSQDIPFLRLGTSAIGKDQSI